jgi:hypothetical protein
VGADEGVGVDAGENVGARRGAGEGGELTVPLAEGPERTAQTKEEVARTVRYERGLLWKAAVALLAVLLIIVINLLAAR